MKLQVPSNYLKYISTTTAVVLGIFLNVFVAHAVTTDCSSDLSSPGTYTLAADTTNTCNITSSGVTLDGAGYHIGSSPVALPDSALSTGWLNMTGNVLLMHMNDISGSVLDSSGNGNNGTTNGTVTFGANGVIGNALSFNGSSYLTLAHSSSFKLVFCRYLRMEK